MKVYVDVSKYWPNDEDGCPRTTNSVYQELLKTPNEIGRNTLRLARDGQLDRGYFSNQVRLARLASVWTGKNISVLDLLRVEDDD